MGGGASQDLEAFRTDSTAWASPMARAGSLEWLTTLDSSAAMKP